MEMKRLSVAEFDKLAKQTPETVYMFDSDNQPWDGLGMKIVAKYSKAVCMLNPNRVCLVGGDGTLCFNDVKEICYESEGGIYMRLEIKCGNPIDTKQDISYVVWLTGGGICKLQ